MCAKCLYTYTYIYLLFMYSMFKKTLQSSIVMYSAFLKPQLEAQETRWGGYMPLPLIA